MAKKKLKSKIDPPKNDGTVEIMPLPWTTEEVEAALDAGWCVAYPPEDYKGSIADWCIAMVTRGYPEDYSDLTMILISDKVWWEVLEECEGE